MRISSNKGVDMIEAATQAFGAAGKAVSEFFILAVNRFANLNVFRGSWSIRSLDVEH